MDKIDQAVNSLQEKADSAKQLAKIATTAYNGILNDPTETWRELQQMFSQKETTSLQVSSDPFIPFPLSRFSMIHITMERNDNSIKVTSYSTSSKGQRNALQKGQIIAVLRTNKPHNNRQSLEAEMLPQIQRLWEKYS